MKSDLTENRHRHQATLLLYVKIYAYIYKNKYIIVQLSPAVETRAPTKHPWSYRYNIQPSVSEVATLRMNNEGIKK